MNLTIPPNESNQAQKRYVLNSPSDYMKFNKRKDYAAGSRSLVLGACGKEREPSCGGAKGEPSCGGAKGKPRRLWKCLHYGYGGAMCLLAFIKLYPLKLMNCIVSEASETH